MKKGAKAYALWIAQQRLFLREHEWSIVLGREVRAGRNNADVEVTSPVTRTKRKIRVSGFFFCTLRSSLFTFLFSLNMV